MQVFSIIDNLHAVLFTFIAVFAMFFSAGAVLAEKVSTSVFCFLGACTGVSLILCLINCCNVAILLMLIYLSISLAMIILFFNKNNNNSKLNKKKVITSSIVISTLVLSIFYFMSKNQYFLSAKNTLKIHNDVCSLAVVVMIMSVFLLIICLGILQIIRKSA